MADLFQNCPIRARVEARPLPIEAGVIVPWSAGQLCALPFEEAI